jgi:hypothetical protein
VLGAIDPIEAKGIDPVDVAPTIRRSTACSSPVRHGGSPDRRTRGCRNPIAAWCEECGREGEGTAWRLAYQPQLGQPWTAVAGVPVYPPPAFFLWWFRFDTYAPRIFLDGTAIASSGGFLAIAIAVGMAVWRAREEKEVATYGSARWATEREVRTAVHATSQKSRESQIGADVIQAVSDREGFAWRREGGRADVIGLS